MNGVAEITVGGKIIKLRFGMVASEEFSKRIFNYQTENASKLSVDLVYSGMLNHAVANSLPIPDYSEVYDLCEEFNGQQDVKEQMEKVWAVFSESKHGSKWLDMVNAQKKKEEAAG